MIKCKYCETKLYKKDIVDKDKEGSWICRGEVYDTREDVPSGRRDEAEYSEIIISTTYKCSNTDCRQENIIYTDDN